MEKRKEDLLRGFNHISDKNCRIIILGTMPGAESLRQQQYYAYKLNQFWRIIFELFKQEITDDYNARKNILLQNNIALWDVLKSCERKDSSDSNIRLPVVNDFKTLFEMLPLLKHICFNGKEAERLFKRLVIGKDIENISYFGKFKYYVLPSTSPANTIKYDTKLKEWRIIKQL